MSDTMERMIAPDSWDNPATALMAVTALSNLLYSALCCVHPDALWFLSAAKTTAEDKIEADARR